MKALRAPDDAGQPEQRAVDWAPEPSDLPRGFDPLGCCVSHLPVYAATGSLRVRPRMFKGHRPRVERILDRDRRHDAPQFFDPPRGRTYRRGRVGLVPSDQDVPFGVVWHAGEYD